MKIVLCGGGSREKTTKLDELFVSLVDKSKFLLYIPIAIDTSKRSYIECRKWFKETFEPLGINKYELWTKEDLEKSKDISPIEFGGIYIGGGNTFYLLKTLKESGAWNFLKIAIEKDIPIYGGSAGAIIFGRSVLTSSDENIVGLKDFSSMNLLRDMEIWCHYKPNKDEHITEIIKKYGLKKIVALSEKSGLYLNDGEINVVGKEPVWIFTCEGKKKVAVGADLLRSG